MRMLKFKAGTKKWRPGFLKVFVYLRKAKAQLVRWTVTRRDKFLLTCAAFGHPGEVSLVAKPKEICLLISKVTESKNGIFFF